MQHLSRRQLSSLLTVAPLEQRTLGFARIAHRITKEPTWGLVRALRDSSEVNPARFGISPDKWARWSPVVHAPTLDRALVLVHSHPPPWVVLALAVHKIRSPRDAHSAMYDLALTCSLLPVVTLTMHALAFFSLVALLRPLASHALTLRTDHATFHFNMLLQAIALFDRSRVATEVAVDVLTEMESRGLTLWPDTERVLIRDNFRSLQLLDHLNRRTSSSSENAQAWLRAYASQGSAKQSAYYLDTIVDQCREHDVIPPYTTKDVKGSPHTANTHYLRSMRDDRQSAFRYFHHLLKLDIVQSPSINRDPSKKSNIDIYDWTTALYAGAYDHTLSASTLLDLFRATKEGTHAYKPTRATYTVVLQGLLWKNALEDAGKLWDEFINEVVGVSGKGEMKIDRKALCVGVDLLVQCGRTEEALCLLDEAVNRDMGQVSTTSSNRTSPYLKVHPIHALFTALLRIRRPDAIFYIWTHLTSLYFIPPTNLMLRILLKAAIQASKMDGESLKGTMSWYIADNRLFRKHSGPSEHDHDYSKSSIESSLALAPSRETLATHLHSLLQTPTPPPVVGIWANRRSTEVARSIFRGMIFGNWPALCAPKQLGGGVTRARAKGNESVFQELARVLTSRSDRFLPDPPTHLGTTRPTMAHSQLDERLGPPLPTIMPSESTFSTYIALLGLSSRASEIPEVLVWMRALNVIPKTETLAVALVFWMEVGLRGPVFEDGWGGGSKTEYSALRTWIREWVGEQRTPTEADVHAGIKRVREMRDGRFGDGHGVISGNSINR